MNIQARVAIPSGRRRFLLTAVAAAVSVSGASRARPLLDAVAPLARLPPEVPVAALDLRAAHDLAG